MMRHYGAHRARGGDNPLRVGVIPVGAIFHLQDEQFFRDRLGGRAICRTPWVIKAFPNGAVGAARRNHDTGLWEDVYTSGRSDTALVRSLRDCRVVRTVAVRNLIVYEELGLCRQPTGYPTLPDVRRFCPARFPSASAESPEPCRKWRANRGAGRRQPWLTIPRQPSSATSA